MEMSYRLPSNCNKLPSNCNKLVLSPNKLDRFSENNSCRLNLGAFVTTETFEFGLVSLVPKKYNHKQKVLTFEVFGVSMIYNYPAF